MDGKSGGAKKSGASEGTNESNNSSVRTAQNSDMGNALASLRGQTPVGNGASTGGSFGEKAIKGAWSVTKKYHRKVGGAVLGAGASATGAMLGFAAGVAQGDVSAAFTGAFAGAKAGQGAINMASNGIKTITNIPNKVNEVFDTYREGAYGAEEAQNLKQIREFKTSSDYKALKDKYGDNFTDDKLRAMLQAGIKDKGNMDKVLSSQNTSDAIGYYTLAQKCPDSVYYDDKKLQLYLEDLGLSQTDAKTMRKNMREFR